MNNPAHSIAVLNCGGNANRPELSRTVPSRAEPYRTMQWKSAISAAFDTVDHNILLERLENWVGLSGMALKWFRSYLEGRGYYVSIGEHKSKWTSMTCGVPQGGLYMLPLSQIMRKNQIAYHSYADDTQIYLALSPNDYSPIDSLCQCIDEINSWICQNRKLKSLHLEKKMKFSR